MKKRTKISDYSLKKNRKGLSMVVSVLLIIVLVLVATGIVWVVVRNVIQKGAGSLSLSGLTLNLEILSASLDGNNVNVNVKRNPGAGKLLGIKFVFSDGTSSKTAEETVSMAELDEESFSFNLIDLEIPNANEVSIALIFESEGGDEILGDIVDTAKFREGGGGIGDPGTGFCGDNIIQNPNSEDPAVAEICDGTSLGGETCESQGFDPSETLACNLDCLSYDTSGCSSSTPSSCDGVWSAGAEDPGVECDGAPLPNNCNVDCTCSTGYTVDGSGGCILSPAILSGLISSVWPGSAPKYFDSPDLPVDGTETDLSGEYVSVSGSPGTCLQISDVVHIIEGAYDMTHIQLPVPITMAAGNTFEIWSSPTCGV